MNPMLYDALTVIVPLVLAIVCHEVAHGLTARALGDPTAQQTNRLTLNPLAHVDPVGTVILPGLLALAHAPVFGWAKPVPVDARRLRHPRRDMILVAAAGPGSNLVLAVLAAVGIGVMARVLPHPGNVGVFIADNLSNFLFFNIFLALFNLLPVPPFDGSHLVEGLLPRTLAAPFATFRRVAFPLVFALLILLPQLFPSLHLLDRVIGPPFDWLAGQYLALARVVGGLHG